MNPPAGGNAYIYFTTNDAAGGAVAPSTAFEAADILLYKDDGTTPRSSTSGWTLSSPFDSLVGQHQLTIDLSDNTDAGFYAAGHTYTAILSPDTETVDGQTVIADVQQFDIGPVDANLISILGTVLTETAGLIAAAFSKFFNKATPTGTVNSLADAVPGAAGGGFIAGANAATSVTTALTANVVGNVTGNLSGSVGSVTGAAGSVTGAVGSVTGNVGGNVTGSAGSVVGAVGSVTGNVGGNVTGTVASVVGNVGGNVVGSVASVTAAVKTTYALHKNTILLAFPLVMTDATTGQPTAGYTVTAEVSINGAAYGAMVNGVDEIGSGSYSIDLAAADTNGNTLQFKFTASGANTLIVGVITQT